MANTVIENIDEYEPLPQAQQEAIELRYLGKKYAEIAMAIDVPVHTVQKWFAPSYDILYKPYLDYCDKRNAERHELATRKLRSLLSKAVRKMEKLLEAENENVQHKAALEIIDRNLGKNVQRVELVGTEELNENKKLLNELIGNPTDNSAESAEAR